MTHGMSGGGEYDRHSDYQMRGGTSHSELVATAARSAAQSVGSEALLVDYGSAAGRVSNPLISGALDEFRTTRPDLTVFVCHNDVLSNDWSDLLRRLRDTDTYLSSGSVEAGRGATTPMISATSFYDPVTLPGTVDLGMSFAAAQWLSGSEAPGTGTALYFDQLQPDDRASMSLRAARDWETFLHRRSDELRPGGRIVMDMMGVPDGGVAAGHRAWALMREIVGDLADAGDLDAEAVDGYVFPVYERTVAEAHRPFDEGVVPMLELEHIEIAAVPNPAADRYSETGDSATFAADTVGFIRAFAEPSLSAALDPTGDAIAELFRRLERRIENEAASFRFDVHVIALIAARH